MNNNAGYTFNHVEKKIIITKAFDKEAKVYKSEAYNQLAQMVKDYPSYSVAVKTIKSSKNKRTYKGLSIEEMRRFMKKQSKTAQNNFENVIEIANTKSSSYAIIKKWFLNNYKDEYNKELEKLNIEKKKADPISAELDEIVNSLTDEELEETEESQEQSQTHESVA